MEKASGAIMVEARELWEKQKYIEAVRIGFDQLTEDAPQSAEQFTSIFLNLAYSLYAASEIYVFHDFQKIFSKYLNIINSNLQLEPPIGYHNNARLFQHHVMATIFDFYFGGSRERDIRRSVRKLEYWYSKVVENQEYNGFNSKLIRLANLIDKSKHPYFVVKFRMPFSLPLPDGEYALGSFKNVNSITIETKKLRDVTSSVGDRYFSTAYVNITGFTTTSNYWTGPSIEQTQVPFNLNICLKALNELIFQIKLINEGIRVKTVCRQDIGQSTTIQYDGDGKEFQSTINFGLGGDALVDVLSKQELTEKEKSTLVKKMQSSKLKLHEELFSEALIEFSNENLTGSFYLLNSACESLIERSLYEVSVQKNRESEYNLFMQGKSSCADCELFKQSKTHIDPPRSAMSPSLFSQLKFFKRIEVATNEKIKEMKKLLLKIRNNDIRNSLIHGRTNEIPHKVVYESINSYKSLRDILGNFSN